MPPVIFATSALARAIESGSVTSRCRVVIPAAARPAIASSRRAVAITRRPARGVRAATKWGGGGLAACVEFEGERVADAAGGAAERG